MSTKRPHEGITHQYVAFTRETVSQLPVSRLKPSSDAERQVRKNNWGDRAQKIMFPALRKMLTIASARDKAILFCQLQGGLDGGLAKSFNYLGYSQAAEQLGKDFRDWDPTKCPVRIQLLPTKDRRRGTCTFSWTTILLWH